MLFVVYGQYKSASTFLARMARYTCEAAGTEQDSIRKRLLIGPLADKRDFWEGGLEPIPSVADQLRPGENMSIKSHSRFQPQFSTTFNRPDIQVIMSYRHPGDAALSAYEAGVRARTRNTDANSGFAVLTTHRRAISRMADHVNEKVTPWLKSGLVKAYPYHQVTQEASTVLAELRDMIGVSQDALDANTDLQDLLSGKQRTYNFNKGTSDRHKLVFSQEDLDFLNDRCSRFIEFCEGKIAPEDL